MASSLIGFVFSPRKSFFFCFSKNCAFDAPMGAACCDGARRKHNLLSQIHMSRMGYSILSGLAISLGR